ncbi:ethanolamine ammonia-lyase light chain [Desulfosarcina alkanivorans]|uniref:Ethanolamine ammonia-lyase small subunit n=1 Tax=Desulfosarcina alkanivorans TaxID=571177 RepID=A0A5K7YMD9_9BACT|nr:ethanolamine ammonia-lyase subunit EutC [Desulfosarcina alkanivorans]BBO70376.1 ethanolamine ammonia-lyase light chain [Desulfosarcina alkanivorans]
MDQPTDGLQRDSWTRLRSFTGARIALGRAGSSLPTRAHLDFQLAHARAKDAVRRPLDMDALEARLQETGVATLRLDTLAGSRSEYLQYPDRGRQLAPRSRALLQAAVAGTAADIALVVADGLSSIAIQRHAVPFLKAFMPLSARRGYTCSPVALVRQGRVAVADPVAEAMGCRLAVILIGERPGLSSPDSMGIYVTYAPHSGCTDADRNCISNIHGRGLSCEQAAARLIYLVTEADRRGVSGVALKDASPQDVPLQGPAADVLPD